MGWDDQTFERFWTRSFQPRMMSLTQQYSALSLHPMAKADIWSAFKDIYGQLKSAMRDGGQDTFTLDRHKTGACVCGAILAAIPVVVPAAGDGRKYPRTVFYANEMLALECGIAVLMSFMFQEARQNPDTCLARIFDQINQAFQYPLTYCGGDYEVQLLNALHLARTEARFDPFFMAHVLYFLEHYNRTLHAGDCA